MARPAAKKGLNTRLLVAVLAALTAIVVIAAYKYFNKEDDKKIKARPIAVEAEQADIGTVERQYTTVGVLDAERKADIRSEMRGRITKVAFRGGEWVKKDALLIQLDDRATRADLKKAKANYILKQSSYKKKKELRKKGAIAQYEMEKAEAEMLQAEGEYENAKIRVDYTSIKAPFDGYVSLRKINEGSSINQQDVLCTINDISPMQIDFKVPANFVKYISVGDDVAVKLDVFTKKNLKAKISSIDSVIDSDTSSFFVRAFIKNPDRLLKPGMVARITMTAGSNDNALVVPVDAVFVGDEGKKYVYKVFASRGRTFAIRVMVKLGITSDDVIELVEHRGLNQGDLVVTTGIARLKDGYGIRVVNQDTTSIQKPINPTDEVKKVVGKAFSKNSDSTQDKNKKTMAVTKDAN